MSNSISGVSVYGKLFSLADCFVWVMKPHVFGFLITPVVMVMYYMINRTDYNSIYILRFSKIDYYFFLQVLKCAWLSFYITLVTAGSIVVVGGHMVTEFINWDRVNSVFYTLVGQTAENVTILKVMGMFLVTSWLRLFFLCVFANCICWITELKILPFILMIALATAEMIFPKYKLFYLIFNIDYMWWLTSRAKLLYILFIPIISFILILVSKYAIHKKEFFDE